MPQETSRFTRAIKIKNPNDDNQYVVLKVIDEISFRDRRFQEYVYTFNNNAAAARQVRVEEIGDNKLKVERIEKLANRDDKQRFQQYVWEYLTEEPPRHLVTHDVKIYETDENGNKNEDVWIKVRRIDKILVMDEKERFQETELELVWPTDEDYDYTNLGTLYDQEPPYRIDPFQAIIDASWGGEFMLVLYEGNKVAAVNINGFSVVHSHVCEQNWGNSPFGVCQLPFSSGNGFIVASKAIQNGELVAPSSGDTYVAFLSSFTADPKSLGDQGYVLDPTTVYVEGEFITGSRTFTVSGDTISTAQESLGLPDNVVPPVILPDGKLVTEMSCPYHSVHDQSGSEISDYIDGLVTNPTYESAYWGGYYVGGELWAEFQEYPFTYSPGYTYAGSFTTSGLLLEEKESSGNGPPSYGTFSASSSFSFSEGPGPEYMSRVLWRFEGSAAPIPQPGQTITLLYQQPGSDYYGVFENAQGALSSSFSASTGQVLSVAGEPPLISATGTVWWIYSDAQYANTPFGADNPKPWADLVLTLVEEVPINQPGQTRSGQGLPVFYGFPFAFRGAPYYSFKPDFNAPTVVTQTPYGQVTGEIIGRMQVSNGDHIIQAFTDGAQDMHIYLDGQDVGNALAAALETTKNSINAIFLDVSLAQIQSIR